MTRAPKKADLPTKICLSCARPFTWRKKWRANWDDVRYCSEACRSGRRDSAREQLAQKRS
ncbi:MAG: DUF2256 domain-containing protein [Acetobacteraceae bacterium]|nr:DUF2256 domain-containing protein [Acetobacteraceae bacterium]